MSLKEVNNSLQKRYFAKTPAFWVKVGDALLLVSTSVTAYGISSHQELIAYTALFTGTLGKIILNFAKE